MPSTFLKKRHSRFLAEIGGTETVQYIPFDADDPSIPRDETTGDILDEDQVYAADPIPLPGLVDLNPSEAMREKIGVKIDFDAVIRAPSSCIEDNSITPKIGDVFILPDGPRKYYVKKILRNMQAGAEFLEFWFAVSRKAGRLG